MQKKRTDVSARRSQREMRPLWRLDDQPLLCQDVQFRERARRTSGTRGTHELAVAPVALRIDELSHTVQFTCMVDAKLFWR